MILGTEYYWWDSTDSPCFIMLTLQPASVFVCFLYPLVSVSNLIVVAVCVPRREGTLEPFWRW